MRRALIRAATASSGDIAHFMSGFRAALWGGGGVELVGAGIACRFIGLHSLGTASAEEWEGRASPQEVRPGGEEFSL
jgi:hypothetical protein